MTPTPAEVEKVAKRIFRFVFLHSSVNRHATTFSGHWEDLEEEQRMRWRDAARWHLAALAKVKKGKQ